RVMQPWAGPGYGFQFIPRVGMEVLVSFLGGDINRPVVVGCLPNHTNHHPHQTPEHKTRSGISTKSSPDAEGYNELMFEDHAGAERISIRAQHDLVEEIRNDHRTHVHNDQRLDVEGESHLNVRGASAATFHANRECTIAGAQQLRVSSTQTVHVGGHATGVYEEGLLVTAGDALDLEAGTDASITAEATLNLNAGGDLNITAGGPVEDDEVPTGMIAVTANRGLELRGQTNVTLASEERIALRCGDSAVILTPTEVIIQAPQLRLVAGERVEIGMEEGASTVYTANVDQSGEAVVVASAGASLSLGEDARLGGATVTLGDRDSAASTGHDEEEEELHDLHIRVCEAGHHPIAERTYLLVVGSRRYQGETDADGMLNEQVLATAVSGQLSVWPESYPNGRRITYDVFLNDLGEPDTPLGASQRLANLGYLPRGSTITAEEAVEGSESARQLRLAVEAFQDWHPDLEPDGTLDGDTARALREVHGD
ncbi:MAG: phage baseplate assembly protein V, partial [Myxococcota bacterium]